MSAGRSGELSGFNDADVSAAASGDSDGAPVDVVRDAHPASLTREYILDTAIAFIDQHGLEKLTMRRLGAACGVEAMALYRYVHSRGIC